MEGFDIRAANADDFEEIVDVCSVSLGWKQPEFDQSLFRWKHQTNPFGASLIMVAAAAGRIVAVRPFMHWRFRRNTETLRAVRAVDTATRPEARGKGLFRTLTETGIEELRESSIDIIFNTPNDQSRPGYLKMGWVEAGRVPVGFRLRSVTSAKDLPGARVAAQKISEPADFGLEVSTGLANAPSDLSGNPPGDRWVTDHDLESLHWRFSEGPVAYRWLPGPNGSGTIARLRRRGTALELLVAGAVGQADQRARTAAVDLALARSKATYALTPVGFPKSAPVPQLGPLLTVRSVARSPQPAQHYWEPGDIELF